jgi:hypothetical protein
MQFQFTVTNKLTGQVFGPFNNIDQVPTNTDWNNVDLKVLTWVDPKYGQLV